MPERSSENSSLATLTGTAPPPEIEGWIVGTVRVCVGCEPSEAYKDAFFDTDAMKHPWWMTIWTAPDGTASHFKCWSGSGDGGSTA